MDDVVFVAVVDAGKHLLHEHCCVPLAEMLTRQNLVEQFAALADSTIISTNKAYSVTK